MGIINAGVYDGYGDIASNPRTVGFVKLVIYVYFIEVLILLYI